MLSISGIYFECANEQIRFLYPNTDLSQMDFLKVVWGGGLVDKERLANSKSLTLIEDTHSQYGKTEDGESEVPQPENVVEEVVTPEEEWSFSLYLGP